MSTSTLLVGYYHDLLLRDVVADSLTTAMVVKGILTTDDEKFVNTGYSIYQRNLLLLEYVQSMDTQALLTFCELVQELWPQIGMQLTTGIGVYCTCKLTLYVYICVSFLVVYK